MSAVHIAVILWGANTSHATRRVSIAEIEEVFANRPLIRGNLRGRVATHLAIGHTDAGRRVVVAFIHRAEARAAIPITAWEKR
jgi:uncharacterized DUF497 family protein